jgi:hypothetical protein
MVLGAFGFRIRHFSRRELSGQEQPEVDPQDGQAWHEPARCICTPHCMHIGASLC